MIAAVEIRLIFLDPAYHLVINSVAQLLDCLTVRQIGVGIKWAIKIYYRLGAAVLSFADSSLIA
mgnify:CR=1 FL=1